MFESKRPCKFFMISYHERLTRDTYQIYVSNSCDMYQIHVICIKFMYQIHGFDTHFPDVQEICIKEPYKRDDILQKRPTILRSLLIVATPYQIPNIYMYTRLTRLVSLVYMYTKYGVATISRLLKMIGLFCKRALQKRRYSAKETYNFKEPTNRSHPIPNIWMHISRIWYGVATVSRIDKITGRFCRISSLS